MVHFNLLLVAPVALAILSSVSASPVPVDSNLEGIDIEFSRKDATFLQPPHEGEKRAQRIDASFLRAADEKRAQRIDASFLRAADKRAQRIDASFLRAADKRAQRIDASFLRAADEKRAQRIDASFLRAVD